MEMVEKEGGLLVFNTDILNPLFFFASAESSAQHTSKIVTNLPAEEGLMLQYEHRNGKEIHSLNSCVTIFPGSAYT